MKTSVLKITAILLIVAGSFVSCDGILNGGNNNNPEKPDELQTKIEAKVENATRYRNIVAVKLMGMNTDFEWVELTRGSWRSGGFTIVLPRTVASNFLRPIVSGGSHPTITDSSISISNSNARILNAVFLGIDRNGNAVTQFFPFEIDRDGNRQYVFFSYVNSDVTIFDYSIRKNCFFPFLVDSEFFPVFPHPIELDKIITTYSIEWEKGWNVWRISRLFELSEEKWVGTERWSTTPSPDKLKWYSIHDLWGRNQATNCQIIKTK